MNTPSHVLINSAVGKLLEKRGFRPVYNALIIGSLMPDVPLTKNAPKAPSFSYGDVGRESL